MNRRRKTYRGFNRKNQYKNVKIIAVILGISVIGTYGYIKLKDMDFIGMVKDNKFIGMISDNIPFIENNKSDAITSDDISKELDTIKKDSEKESIDKDKLSENSTKEKTDEESSVEVSENIKLAKVDGWNIYTIQVASIQDDKDIKKIEAKLTENKLPFSIVEVDGVKKVQTYSFFEEDATRSQLENVKKVFEDAFISQVKVPMLSIEYTDKYEYIGEISNELNKLITNFGEESKFWKENQNNKEALDMSKYNQILTDRKSITESITSQVEKIDYEGMDVFKTNLVKYVDDVNEKIAQSSKAANEQKYYISQGLFVSCMQGYFSFVNIIKEA
ncbi:MAG: hypothetical protein RRZ84_03180 [Romboutsia sp.]